MTESSDTGIFLRYRGGFIKPDIKTKTKALVAELKKNDDYRAVFRALIKDIGDGNGPAVHPESTWHQAAKELFERYGHYSHGVEPPVQKLIELLEMLSAGDGSTTIDWDVIRDFIIANLGDLSPANPRRFVGYDNQEVQRDDQGNYFYEENGQLVRVHGLKTPAEEKLQFYTNDAQMRYGRLYYILRYIALFDIAYEYQHHPKYFATKVSCVLYDNGGSTSYLNWNWVMPNPFEYVPLQWHPRSPYSNPDWLSSDLIMNLPFKNGEPGQKIVPIIPSDNERVRWESAFKGYRWQLEIPVVSNILLGEEPEVYFDFLGRKVRWVNGSAFTQPIIIVPCHDEDGSDGIEIARKFLSVLNIEHEVQLSERLISLQQIRYLPWIKDYRIPVYQLIDPTYALPQDDPTKYSEKRWYALAFIREAVSSLSIYYAFLNYYKVIELAFDDDGARIIAWINQCVEQLCKDKGLDWYNVMIAPQGRNAGQYLYTSGRVAIAHAVYDFKKKKVTHNPDSVADYQTTRNDLGVMRELARLMLEGIK
ncbi:hypothetical protein IPG36_05365 [bacterium]|nr:MAG: hypothetical protein IPG36_05365 [bacterium]